MTGLSLDAVRDVLQQGDLLQAVAGPVENQTIHHLAFDSRKVEPHSLFVAISGEAADGHQFIDKAVQNGAVAVVCMALPDAAQRRPEVAYFQVSDSRTALARLAGAMYHHPSHHLRLIGITGTNGKSTTTFLVYHVLEALGIGSGLVGTIHITVRGHVLPSTLTTPDPLALNALLKEMVEAGCGAAVMEVSSHALDQRRVEGVRYEAAAFTNLTHDHLDYHRTPEAYLLAKKRLFDMLPAESVALYNADDPAGSRMAAETKARVFSYGIENDADFRARIIANTLHGLKLEIDGEERQFRLVGEFNAYNLLCAYGIVRAMGFEKNAVLDALATAAPVPGRFEQIVFENGTVAIVDYAHTPDALENVLETAKALKPEGANLWCLFGCGGDRDRTKRPEMGRIAEALSDRVVVTSDNPRTEHSETILADIRAGLGHPEQANWIVNREEAIRFAAKNAAPGDVILIAGKGHETYQILGTEKRHFDDREEIRQAMKEEAGIEAATHNGTFD